MSSNGRENKNMSSKNTKNTKNQITLAIPENTSVTVIDERNMKANPPRIMRGVKI